MATKKRAITWITQVASQIVLGFAFGVGLYAALWALAVIGAFPVVGD